MLGELKPEGGHPTKGTAVHLKKISQANTCGLIKITAHLL
jgi:hypothetical protein